MTKKIDKYKDKDKDKDNNKDKDKALHIRRNNQVAQIGRCDVKGEFIMFCFIDLLLDNGAKPNVVFQLFEYVCLFQNVIRTI